MQSSPKKFNKHLYGLGNNQANNAIVEIINSKEARTENSSYKGINTTSIDHPNLAAPSTDGFDALN